MTPPNGGAVPYQRPLPGWAVSCLQRPLPRTVRPVHDETLHSYLGRLAGVNGLNPGYFTDYVRGSKRRSAPIPPDAVITLSGQAVNSMRYAILELCTARELAAMNVAGRPRPGSSIAGEKCVRCTHARGVYDPVVCWRHSEDVICLVHRRWTTGSGQLDLTAHNDIVLANKRHRQLIRHHGRDAATRAFNQASSIVSEWTERGTYRSRVNEHMRRFHGSGWRVSRDDPALLASQYLPAVALTSLLVSRDWKALASHSKDNTTFVAEVRRTVDPGLHLGPISLLALRRATRTDPAARAREPRPRSRNGRIPARMQHPSAASPARPGSRIPRVVPR